MKFNKVTGNRYIPLLLAFVMMSSATGCSNNDETNQTEDSYSVTTEAEAVSDLSKKDKNAEEAETSPVDVISENSEITSDADEAKGKLNEESLDETSAEKGQEANDGSMAEDLETTKEQESEGLSYEIVEEEEEDSLTSTQRNSINMLNYMTALTQRVNEEKSNQLFLESAYNSFDNLYPNSVDTKTQAQISSLMDTIQSYRMISVKRDRLEYIYEQNRAQALRQAIPNPVGLLSAVQSGGMLKAAAAVLYMAVDAASSYKAATSQADLQFIKDGWELDDAESAELHNSTKNALNYMWDMVRSYDLPGDYALNKEAVEDFVLWSGKPDSQLVSKIAWFESQQATYSEFGPYWLELAKDYYNNEEYEKCFDSIEKYESVSTRIARKDIDYATALPMAIISAKEIMDREEYVAVADKYCSLILANTKDHDWALRYFSAQIYMDLYSITKNTSYLDQAYKIAFDNVVILVDEQRKLNSRYLADAEEVKAKKDASKREKEEVKNYNKAVKEERKIALPPVSESLYLNCDLLFALAEERNISSAEQDRIESVLHENDDNIFLTEALDNRFWFGGNTEQIKASKINVTFDGETLKLPAVCVTDRSKISVSVSGNKGIKLIEDWTVDSVKRPKNANCSEFVVTFKSKTAKTYKYKAGETVTIKVVPVAENKEEYLEFKYDVVDGKILFLFNVIRFEREK